MKNKPGILKLLIETYKEGVKDRVEGLASALAYYQLLTIAPLAGFLIFISNKILGVIKTNENVVPLLKNWFTPPFVKLIVLMLEKTQKMDVSELYNLSLISGMLLAFATKEYFGQIKDIIEIIWNQRTEKPGIKEGIIRLLIDLKVMGISMAIITIYLFLRALLPHPYIVPEENFHREDSIWILIIQGILEIILFFTLYLYFFSKLPPVKVYWKNAIPGALLGAFLYEIGRVAMRIYIYHNPEADAAESFISIVIWVLYVNIGLVYAAEFNKVYISSRQHIDIRSLKFDE